MAIDFQLLDTDPYIGVGLTTKQDVSVVSRNDADALIPKIFDLCLYEDEYREKAFAELGGVINDDYKNDKTDLLFSLSLITDTVTIKLFKIENGRNVEKATITDNTYGVYSAASSFTDQLNIGFVADWNKILDLLGIGTYFFTADRVIISLSSSLTSHKFELDVFSEEKADGTIKIVTTQNGIIEGGNNYRDFTWTGYIRLYGFFGQPEYTHTKEDFIDTNRNIQQIQESIRTVYKMSLKLHPSSVIVPFIKDRLLANAMVIIPYGLFDFLERYRDIPVSTEGIDESKYYERNTKSSNVFLFTDRNQTPLKRKFAI